MAVIVDDSKCKGVSNCGLCIEICALNAMEKVEDKPVVNADLCPECGLCVMNCPNEAISKP